MAVTQPASTRILLLVSAGVRHFLENVLISMRKCGVPPDGISVLCPREDQPAFAPLKEAGLFGEFIIAEELFAVAFGDSDGNYSSYGSKEFARLTALKWPGIAHLLKQPGTGNVVYTDVDITWLANPLPLLSQIATIYDLAIQTEGLPVFPPRFCTGFMSFKASEFSFKFLDALQKNQVKAAGINPHFHDQFVFNTVVENQLQILRNIFPLSELSFCNGLMAKQFPVADGELAKIMEGKLQPMIFHANWTVGIDNKKLMLEHTGNWLLDKPQPGSR